MCTLNISIKKKTETRLANKKHTYMLTDGSNSRQKAKKFLSPRALVISTGFSLVGALCYVRAKEMKVNRRGSGYRVGLDL